MMIRSTLFRWAAVFALMIATVSSTAFAQEGETLTISGTFQASAVWGEPGSDLYDVYLNGQPHTWTLTMHGVTYAYDYHFFEGPDQFYDEAYATTAMATSFQLEFFGPDGATLNTVVSGPLAGAGATLVNGEYTEFSSKSPYSRLYFTLYPADPSDGVRFSVWAENSTWPFTQDYPTFHTQTIPNSYETIEDSRIGNYGTLESISPAVYIDFTGTPPPPIAHVSIADGSVQEGNKGTRALALTLSLTIPRSEPISVQYQTSDGTAKSSGTKNSPADYTAATGTVTFQPGQISQTISISVKGDRSREPNETFTVTLSNPTGATIADGVATATILNDD